MLRMDVQRETSVSLPVVLTAFACGIYLVEMCLEQLATRLVDTVYGSVLIPIAYRYKAVAGVPERRNAHGLGWYNHILIRLYCEKRQRNRSGLPRYRTIRGGAHDRRRVP